MQLLHNTGKKAYFSTALYFLLFQSLIALVDFAKIRPVFSERSEKMSSDEGSWRVGNELYADDVKSFRRTSVQGLLLDEPLERSIALKIE
ncbi:hypothetical protein [Rodentibacter rarus]|uniref:hypothetical protein n=1 Tax=Rodentibacter rarus TaxID=1908260 RepID=UPI0015C36386|nr:hypothetical protein [Rodentibacter rarus]